MSLSLFAARDEFVKKHKEPEVITLESETEVINKGNTSTHHPNGSFENSWMKYWMAFSGQDKDFVCSVDGQPIWIEGDVESCKKCREINRTFELLYHPDTEKAEKTYNGREAHGAHLEYNGKTYIAPMCSSHNTELGEEEKPVKL